MSAWMANGDENHVKLKRYIHRNLCLPRTLHNINPEEAEELLINFAYLYVDALLKYCSDDLKEGGWLGLVLLLHILVVTHTTHTGYFIMNAKTSREFRLIPVGKVSATRPAMLNTIVLTAGDIMCRCAWCTSTPSTTFFVVKTFSVRRGMPNVICQRRCSCQKKEEADALRPSVLITSCSRGWLSRKRLFTKDTGACFTCTRSSVKKLPSLSTGMMMNPTKTTTISKPQRPPTRLSTMMHFRCK